MVVSYWFSKPSQHYIGHIREQLHGNIIFDFSFVVLIRVLVFQIQKLK